MTPATRVQMKEGGRDDTGWMMGRRVEEIKRVLNGDWLKVV